LKVNAPEVGAGRLPATVRIDNGMDAPFLDRHRSAKVEIQVNHF
jgi:hypothetical protein